MRNFVVSGVFVFLSFFVSTAHGTDLNCPDGGEPDFDEIVNEMMTLAPEGTEFYEGILISKCDDLEAYEIICSDNGWWRERGGYLTMLAKYAGHSHNLYWENDEEPITSVFIVNAPGGNQDPEEISLFLTADELPFYFKDEDVSSEEIWYSRDALNDDGLRHMVTYRLGNDVYVFGFEDLRGGGDGDYQDLVLMVEHTAPTCIPAMNAIPDQAIAARGTFDPVDLAWAVLASEEYDKANIAWTWTNLGGGHVAVNNISSGLAYVNYQPQDWHGAEELVFTATVNGFSFEGDPVTFQVMEPGAPVVNDIPDRVIRVNGSFEQINHDDYVELPPNYSPEDVEWTTQGGDGKISVEINTNRVATITYPSSWRGTKEITFIATINPSGSTTTSFTVVSYLTGLGVGGTARTVSRFDLLVPWIGIAVLSLLALAVPVIVWHRKRKGVM